MVERISQPGAITSTRVPKLLKLVAKVSSTSPVATLGPLPPGRPSESAYAPTQMTPGALAGEKPEASLALLPAAATMTTPFCTQAVTAEFMDWENEPPRLMLATAIWV